MFQTITTNSNAFSLDKFIHKLSNHREVDGIVVIGSASEERLAPASDYDLVVVLSDESVPLEFGTTYINDRLTDLMFLTVAEIKQVISLNEPVNVGERLGQIVRWLIDGKAVLDRNEWIEHAQRKVQSGNWLLPEDESRRYQIWYKINFDLRHAKRMVLSNDPVYQKAVEIRLLFSIFDVFLGYFLMRGIIWNGTKAAIRYLLDNDPEFLTSIEQCLAENNLSHKVEMYEKLAKRATEPAGGLWANQDTAIQNRHDTEWSPGLVEECLKFYQHLLSS